MAATNFTPISLYYSTTASAVPTSGNLVAGELALNTADMKLYAKNSAGTVTLLASNAGASGSVTSVAVSGGTTGLTTSGGPITTSGTITIAGTLATTNGGTNLTSFTSGGAMYATSTSALTTGTLPTTAGGTGLTSFTSGGVVYASSTSALATSGSLTFNGSKLGLNGATVAGILSVATTTNADFTSQANLQNSSIATLYSSQTTTVLTFQGAAGNPDKFISSDNFGGTQYLSLGYLNGSTKYNVYQFDQNGTLYMSTNATERLRINSSGAWGLSGANYGTSGQVLTSAGSSAAPTWSTPTGISTGKSIAMAMIFGF